MTCPTCTSRMVAYPHDWRVCLACAVFERAAHDAIPGQAIAAPWSPRPARAAASEAHGAPGGSGGR